MKGVRSVISVYSPSKKHRHQATRFDDALETTVVAAISAFLRNEVARGTEQGEHAFGQIELLARRFTASHVQFQVAQLELRELILKLNLQLGELGYAHIDVGHNFS